MSKIYCTQLTEVFFASFLSSGFTNMAVINPLERKLAKRTSVHCGNPVSNEQLSTVQWFKCKA